MSSDEKAELEEEVRKAEEEITRTIKVREKPVRKPLDTSLLPVDEINLYPEGTTTEDGELKEDFVEIGTEETLRLERIPEKVYIVKTIRHKVIRKSELKEKHPEERDRKSTRLNSSHANISYAVFCLKKKKKYNNNMYIMNI